MLVVLFPIGLALAPVMALFPQEEERNDGHERLVVERMGR